MFSIIAPMDSGRFEQFKTSKLIYDTFNQEKEFIIPTRNYDTVLDYLTKNDLMKDVRLIKYEYNNGFNPSMALNIGVKNAKYDTIIITSPEVKPVTRVLDQLEPLIGNNIVCHTLDENSSGDTRDLVSRSFREDTPGMYFLAMFNKSDIAKINGWDNDFMLGYAYEDTDFGMRWVKAKLPFMISDDIVALHQFHERKETTPNRLQINYDKVRFNQDNNIIFCDNGLNQV